MDFLKTTMLKFFSLLSKYLLLVCLGLFLVSASADKTEPLIIILSDFDGTITQFAGNRWLSPATLTRINDFQDNSFGGINSALNREGKTFDELSYELEITQAEEFLFRYLFYSEKKGIPGYDSLWLEPLPYLKNRDKKQLIIPGIYKMEYRETFSEDNTLIRDYKRTKEFAKQEKRSITESFSIGLDLINSNINKTNSRILIHTARGQSPEAFARFFKILKKEKLLHTSTDNLDKIKVYSLKRPESSRYGADFENRKLVLAENEIKSLNPLLTADSSQEVHIVFAEDEVSYMDKAHKFFEKLTMEAYLNRAYIHLLFTGPTELTNSFEKQKGKRVVTYKNGIATEISSNHAKLLGLPLTKINEWNNSVKNLYPSMPNSCKNTFLEGGK